MTLSDQLAAMGRSCQEPSDGGGMSESPATVAKKIVVNWGSEWAVIDEAVKLSESQLISLQQRIAHALTTFAAQQVRETEERLGKCHSCKTPISNECQDCKRLWAT